MIPKHLDDCGNCKGHQRMHHNDKTGKCMIGSSIDDPCPCPGFSKK